MGPETAIAFRTTEGANAGAELKLPLYFGAENAASSAAESNTMLSLFQRDTQFSLD